MTCKTRAPMRISFAGGGTDVEPYASEHGGCVISAAIQVYAYAEYPSKQHEPSELEKTVARHFEKEASKLTITSEALPMSGLGGSASCFVVGIKAIRPDLEGNELAELAFHLERNVMCVRGGKQDQYAAVFGGLNYMTFGKVVEVQPLDIPEGLEDLLLLVYVGKRKHNGHDIIKDQMERDNLDNFNDQKKIVNEMRRAIKIKDITYFGFLLEEAWESKVCFSPYIETKEIRAFHTDCLRSGAIGSKLTGAGGGGYMLLMENPLEDGNLRSYLGFVCEPKIDFSTVKFDTEGAKCL